ncbi:hypothetical protein BJF90_20650 [Pseudonocardia sp. CNS-004]|nr:hypothetical protein BJF90_20650 [Pseudonocardia sp. CNS-004]
MARKRSRSTSTTRDVTIPWVATMRVTRSRSAASLTWSMIWIVPSATARTSGTMTTTENLARTLQCRGDGHTDRRRAAGRSSVVTSVSPLGYWGARRPDPAAGHHDHLLSQCNQSHQCLSAVRALPCAEWVATCCAAS